MDTAVTTTAPAPTGTTTTGRPAPLGRRFAHLLAATGLSNLADGVLQVGVPLLAITLTDDPGPVALVSAAGSLPWLLLALHVGVLVDRVDRARLLAVATAVRVLVLLAATGVALAGALTLPVLAALVLGLGAAEVLADSASGSLVPGTVPRERLAAANSRLLGMQQLANAFLGGPLAGVVVGIGAAALFGLPAGLCALALLLVVRGVVRRGRAGADARTDAPAPQPTRRSVHGDIAEGMRFLRGHRVVGPLVVLAAVLNLAGSAYFSVLVLWVVGEGSAVGLSAPAYGVVSAALAAGALLGAVVAERLVPVVGEARLIAGAWVAQATLLAAPVLVPTAAVLITTAALMGLTNMVGNVVSRSLRQRLVPDRLLGRVGGAGTLLVLGAMPLGALAAAAVSQAAGVAAVLGGATAVSLVAALVTLRVVTPQHVAAADAAVHEAEPAAAQLT